LTHKKLIDTKFRTASFAVLTACLIFACPTPGMAGPPTTIYAGTEGGLLKSVNGGNTWQNLSPSGGFESTVTAIAIDPVNTHTIYVGGGNKLYKTTDDGAHWTVLTNGLPTASVTIYSAIVIDPTNTSIIYAATGDTAAGSVYKTTNGGTGWTNIGAGVPVQPGAGLSVTDLAIDPTNHLTLYLTGTNGTQVAKTTDGGNTWTALTGGFYQTLAINPANPSNIFLTGPFQLAVTTDGGSTFTDFILTGPGGIFEFVNGLAIDPNNPTTVYAGGGNVIFKSTTTPPAFPIFGSGLGSSVNVIHALTVDPANSQTVYAATDAGVYISSNGGSTWTGPSTPASDLAAVSLALEPNPGQAAAFQATENAATQLIESVGSTPGGAFACFLLQALDNEIPLLENFGVLSSSQGKSLQAQIQPVLSTAPCK
jgi:hypothetical protein